MWVATSTPNWGEVASTHRCASSTVTSQPQARAWTPVASGEIPSISWSCLHSPTVRPRMSMATPATVMVSRGVGMAGSI